MKHDFERQIYYLKLWKRKNIKIKEKLKNMCSKILKDDRTKEVDGFEIEMKENILAKGWVNVLL